MARLAVLAAMLASATAATRWHHTTHTFSEQEFQEIGRSAPDAVVRFSAALPWRNFDKLDTKLAEISNPKSSSYGKWMTQQEVNTLTAPEMSKRTKAMKYLKSKGARCVHMPHSLKCEAPVAVAEDIFQTEFTAFAHTPRNGAVVHRIHPRQSYSFPSELVGAVDFFTNVAEFPTQRRRNGRLHAFGGPRGTPAKLRGVGAGTDYIVTVETLANIYGTAPGNNASSQAPAEFQDDQSFNLKDLAKFAAANGLPVWNVTNKVGPFAPANPDVEATLDEQYIGAVGYGNTNWYWTESDWMYEWTQALAAAKTLPSVFSISWGWSEADQCTIDTSGPCSAGGTAGSHAYVAATNQGFAAVGARGITVLVSSGDSGAHGRTDDSCAHPQTRPDWPTASPYITAVGATQLQAGTQLASPKTPWCKAPPSGLTPCAGGGTEIVASTATGALIVSGGGFSNVAATPAWQTAAVAGYLKSGALLPGAGNFNSSGRAYPDVAALGHNYIIEVSGQPTQVDGTSCSAPVFGGVVALANAARLAAGKPTLGFLTPAIYSTLSTTAGVFTDITVGNNKCTEDGCAAGCTGFGATAGYDPVTGFGTPHIPAFVQAALAL